MGFDRLKYAPVDYAVAALEDRSAPRIMLNIPANLRPSGVTGFAVNVTNLSLSGFACEATTGMPARARCWLSLPGLSPLQAEVIWNNGASVGCAFENVMNQSVLDAILNRFGVVVPDGQSVSANAINCEGKG